MNFAKKFPGLHGAETTGIADDEGNNQYSEDDIENHCLDRTEVMKAFQNIKTDIRTDDSITMLTERSLIKGIELEEKRLGIYGG